MVTEQLSQVLASFDAGAVDSVGRVLFPLEKDLALEERYFRGWYNHLSPALGRIKPSTAWLQIVEHDGRKVLEWPEGVPCLLINGDASWSDVEVSCVVQSLYMYRGCYSHDEITFDHEGRTGVALRVQDSRRHYFAGFQDGTKLVIAVRDDANWIVLNSKPFPIDLRRYYTLAARCIGNRIEVLVDGQRELSAIDARWPGGMAGLFTSCPARWTRGDIRCTEDEAASIERRRVEHERSLAALASGVPKLEKLQELTLRLKTDSCGGTPTYRGLLDPKAKQLLFSFVEEGRSGRQTTLLATDLEGEEIWRRQLPAGGALCLKSGDINLDGVPEVIVQTRTRLMVLNGGTGETTAEAEYPDGSPFVHLRGEKAQLDTKGPRYFWTAGRDQPARLYSCEWTGAGGHTIWSHDHELRPRWVHHNSFGKFGHNVHAYDVNGDGREEVVAAYYTLDDDGEYVWQVKDHDLIYKQDHADNFWVGDMATDGDSVLRIMAACGEAGILVVDASNGEIVAQTRGIGHLQGVWGAGNYRHDRPGKEVWLTTDWGSPGLSYLVDRSGQILHRFQPNPQGASGRPVRWWPDGRDLLMLRSFREGSGLYDGFGRRLVDLNPLSYGAVTIDRVFDLPTDQMLVLSGARLEFFAPKA